MQLQSRWLFLIVVLFMNFLFIFVGGGLGSCCRYGVVLLCRAVDFPLFVATFLVNVIASFVLGYLLSTHQSLGVDNRALLLLSTGFCGGFSTFSTFSQDNLVLLEQNQGLLAVFNILLNVGICLIAVALGHKLGK